MLFLMAAICAGAILSPTMSTDVLSQLTFLAKASAHSVESPDYNSSENLLNATSLLEKSGIKDEHKSMVLTKKQKTEINNYLDHKIDGLTKASKPKK